MKNSIGHDFKYCLVGKINGLAEEVKRARVRLIKGKTECYRNEVAITKRFIGSEARHYLLAYSFMKNVPYSSVERKCAEGNKPNAERILEIVHSHMYYFERRKWTLDMVTAWLKGEEIAVVEKKMSASEKAKILFASNA